MKITTFSWLLVLRMDSSQHWEKYINVLEAMCGPDGFTLWVSKLMLNNYKEVQVIFYLCFEDRWVSKPYPCVVSFWNKLTSAMP